MEQLILELKDKKSPRHTFIQSLHVVPRPREEKRSSMRSLVSRRIHEMVSLDLKKRVSRVMGLALVNAAHLKIG